MREITDGLKHDLAMVVCENMTCETRGEYGKCYTEQHIGCTDYKLNKDRKKDEK